MLCFKNTIKYNDKMGYKICCFYTTYPINLSSLLFVNDKQPIFPFFSFSSIINSNKIISIKKHKKQCNIILHPEIEKLAKAFKISNLTSMTIEKVPNKKIMKNMYNNLLDSLYDEIENFIYIRHMIIADNKLGLLQKDTETIINNNNDDYSSLKEAFQAFKQTIPSTKLTFFDYCSMIENKKDNYSIIVNQIYDYTTLRNELKKYIDSENEYYIPFQAINETKTQINEIENTSSKKQLNSKRTLDIKCLKVRLNNLYKLTDYINDCPAFNKETLKNICNTLEDYIEKEKALDEFVYHILKNSKNT